MFLSNHIFFYSTNIFRYSTLSPTGTIFFLQVEKFTTRLNIFPTKSPSLIPPSVRPHVCGSWVKLHTVHVSCRINSFLGRMLQKNSKENNRKHSFSSERFFEGNSVQKLNGLTYCTKHSAENDVVQGQTIFLGGISPTGCSDARPGDFQGFGLRSLEVPSEAICFRFLFCIFKIR